MCAIFIFTGNKQCSGKSKIINEKDNKNDIKILTVIIKEIATLY